MAGRVCMCGTPVIRNGDAWKCPRCDGPGAYVCGSCGNTEIREREVTCWTCGKGEMRWTVGGHLRVVEQQP